MRQESATLDVAERLEESQIASIARGIDLKVLLWEGGYPKCLVQKRSNDGELDTRPTECCFAGLLKINRVTSGLHD